MKIDFLFIPIISAHIDTYIVQQLIINGHVSIPPFSVSSTPATFNGYHFNGYHNKSLCFSQKLANYMFSYCIAFITEKVFQSILLVANLSIYL